MNDLSVEDKKRIEAEEKYRAQVRGDLEEEKPKKKGKGCLILVLIIIGFFVLVGAIGSSSSNKSSSTKTTEQTQQDEKAKQEKTDALAKTFCSERSKGERAIDLNTYIAMFEKPGETVTLKNTTSIPMQDNCNKVAKICMDNWPEQECQNIAEKKIWIGMTQNQLELSWGLPSDRNNSTYSFGVNSQWVYGNPIYGASYVYLEGKTSRDMKVTSWQD